MAETRYTLQTFAPHVPVSVPLQAVSFVRAAFVNFVSENPLTWFWNQGRRNAQADMEGEQHRCMDRCTRAYAFFVPWTGPLYVIGAPDRNIEPGKAVLATPEELKGARASCSLPFPFTHHTPTVPHAA